MPKNKIKTIPFRKLRRMNERQWAVIFFLYVCVCVWFFLNNKIKNYISHEGIKRWNGKSLLLCFLVVCLSIKTSMLRFMLFTIASYANDIEIFNFFDATNKFYFILFLNLFYFPQDTVSCVDKWNLHYTKKILALKFKKKIVNEWSFQNLWFFFRLVKFW